MRQIGLLLALLGVCSIVLAEPMPLTVRKNVKNSSARKYIEAVHLEIPTNTGDIAAIRLAIVEGMLNTKGRAWTLEGEGEGYILARFDYRGHINVMRIEYNDYLVQLKYHGSSEAYHCKILMDDGICYSNHRNYYNYTKNLRASIERELGVYRSP
jgi:hypothetical protein